jgi:hypothetical protein
MRAHGERFSPLATLLLAALASWAHAAQSPASLKDAWLTSGVGVLQLPDPDAATRKAKDTNFVQRVLCQEIHAIGHDQGNVAKGLHLFVQRRGGEETQRAGSRGGWKVAGTCLSVELLADAHAKHACTDGRVNHLVEHGQPALQILVAAEVPSPSPRPSHSEGQPGQGRERDRASASRHLDVWQ